MSDATTVLFACVHNAGRSQIAAAWFNLLADPSKARATSAGTQPAASVHIEVVTAMKEVGIDLSGVRPQLLSDELASKAQYLVTMGCGEACPVVPGVRRFDWQLPDPKGQPLGEVRRLRDRIRDEVRSFVQAQGWYRPD